MRQENILTKFSLSFPLPGGKPDGNGAVYTKEAVEKALSEMPTGLPIIYRSKTGESVKIGCTYNRPSTIKYCADHTIRFEIECIINTGGTECKHLLIKM